MFTNVPGVPGSAAFSIDDFVLNDAKVALPKVVLHENSVTPEAQTLMDAYARIVDRPIAHGLVTASGDVVPAGEKPVRRRFSFTAPLFLAVTLPPPVKNDSPEGRAVAASTRLALLLAIDGIRLAESLEYDARVVERDGVRVLEVVEFKSGARSATSEFTFDADGLVATLRRRDGADPAAPTSDVAFRFEWEKSDGSCRVRAAELTVGFTRKRYEIGRSKIDGVDFVTSYSVVVVENGTSTTFRYCVEDLVLNGKKVEASKPAADPPTDGGKK
jgi:hypothetical protein